MERVMLQELRRYNADHKIETWDDAMYHLLEYAARHYSSFNIGVVYAVCRGVASEYMKLVGIDAQADEPAAAKAEM